MIGVLIMGGIVFFIGGIVLLMSLKSMRRRKRILGTPTSPIAQAPGTGPVELKGRIVPSEQGVLAAPFSGRQGVWVRVIVQEWRQHGRSGSWHTILNEIDSRSFFIDDGSGQMARVLPQGAEVILDTQTIGKSGTFNDAQPHFEGFLASRGLKSTNFLGFNKSMQYQEEIMVPNDNVYALGPSRREAGPPVNDGYRMVPSSQLIMFAGAGEANELILTSKTEEQLVSKLMTGFIVGLVMLGLGGVGGVVGLIGMIVEAM
ncbi:MAG: hypothetical protein U0174_14515 [Polyangiaceae bacterium]